MNKFSFQFIILFLLLIPVLAQQQPDTTFTGSAFTYPKQSEPILIFKESDVSMEPEIA